MVTEATIGEVHYGGRRLVYEVRGRGDRPFVALHGLLVPGGINGTLARLLAEQGNRVILLDLLGHGRSDKPTDASEHRLEFAAEQVIALLDQLELDEAVVGGMSLGANVTLQLAATQPHRVRAAVCEMPVLERGTVGVMLGLLPLFVALRYGGWPVRTLFRTVQRLPRTPSETFNAILDTAGEPSSMAAIMHGYTAGPFCPSVAVRRTIETPTLVIGHAGDRLHPIDDAETLVREMPNARLVKANSFLELRTKPARLVAEIARFLDEVWDEELAQVGEG